MKPNAAKRVREAHEFLVAVKIPVEQQNERSALTLLALADLAPGARWKTCVSPLRRVTGIIDWIRTIYGVAYAPNTRETIRRQTIHQFVQHGLLVENPDRPDRPINSPKWCYQLAPGALRLLQKFGSKEFQAELDVFVSGSSTANLIAASRKNRSCCRMGK